jgi:SAM-dependent methyltransferase
VARDVDRRVVADFGREWRAFDQSDVPDDELRRQFESDFAVFPWADLSSGAVGVDAGCGSGRWARLAAARVGHLHCIDASVEAIAVAGRAVPNVPIYTLHVASLDELPLEPDFGYCLGVLHTFQTTRPRSRDRSVQTMRNNALDRFATRLEKRFTKDEIAIMLAAAGLGDIVFAPGPPYWCGSGSRTCRPPITCWRRPAPARVARRADADP